MNPIPIVLFVYNRPQHTAKVLKELSQCPEAAHTPIYVYADGPKDSASAEQLEKIENVRVIVRQQSWAQNLKLIPAPRNKGLAPSVMEGLDAVFEQHEAVIVLEDDIVPQIGFLQYMNAALALYEQDDQVFGVSAFAHPMSRPAAQQTFFLPIGASWGWGTWRRAWKRMIRDPHALLKAVEARGIAQYNFGGYYFYDILKAQAEGKIDSWACQFHASIFLAEGLFLFPHLSLVKNIGFDSTGTHCEEDNFFSKTPLTNFIAVQRQTLTYQSDARKAVEEAFRTEFGTPSFWQRLRHRIFGK